MKIEKRDGGIYDVELEVADRLHDCPFCGHPNPSLTHTHTASYWMECVGCGAEVHDNGRIGASGSQAAHLASARRVVKRWNTRV